MTTQWQCLILIRWQHEDWLELSHEYLIYKLSPTNHAKDFLSRKTNICRRIDFAMLSRDAGVTWGTWGGGGTHTESHLIFRLVLPGGASSTGQKKTLQMLATPSHAIESVAAVNWILQHTLPYLRRSCTGKFPPGKRFDKLITYITISLTLDHSWHRHLYDLIRMKNNRESEFICGKESWQLVTCIAVDLKGWFLILITLEMIHLLTVIVFLCTLLSCNGRLVNLGVIHAHKMPVIQSWQYGMCSFGHSNESNIDICDEHTTAPAWEGSISSTMHHCSR